MFLMTTINQLEAQWRFYLRVHFVNANNIVRMNMGLGGLHCVDIFWKTGC